MPNILKIVVDDPDNLLNAGAYGAGALIRIQQAAVEAGPYTDVSGTGSTPTIPIVAGVNAYTGFDPNGASTTWYQTRYENAGGSRLSEWSDPFQVTIEGSDLICSLASVKRRLRIDPTDTTKDDDLIEIIGEVTDEIIGFTQQLFVRTPASGTDTFYFDVSSDGSGVVLVPGGIASISSVDVAGVSQPGSGGTYTTLDASAWFLRPAIRRPGFPYTELVLSDVGSFPTFYRGQNVVRVTGALGWPAVPRDVAGIGRAASVRRYLAKQSGAADLAVVGPTGGMTVLRSISTSEMKTLERYRVPSIG